MKPGDVFILTTGDLYGGHVLRDDGTTVPIISPTEQPVPHPHDRGWGWLKDGGSMVPVLPNTAGLWTDTPSVVGAATTLAPTVPDALSLGSAKADALRRALNELDTYAAGGPADLTKELRALLGLPRKT